MVYLALKAFWVASSVLSSYALTLPPASSQASLSDVVAADYIISTVRESAVQARRILRLENIGTMSTVFQRDRKSRSDKLLASGQDGVAGSAISLMEYYADCEPQSGNPTFLAVSIATAVRNAAAGSNVTLSLRWHPTDGRVHSVASLPRLSLIGHIERIDPQTVEDAGIKACYLQEHGDAAAWTPGNDIHESWWARLVVDHLYWFGGFGDRAYIGWIPLSTWTSITNEEIEAIKLPGEAV